MAQSKAFENLCNYINKVAGEVQGRIEQNKVPTSAQLEVYIKSFVTELQKQIKGAPKEIQNKVAAPFEGYWDFQGNAPLADALTVHEFAAILAALAKSFQAAPAAQKGAAAAGGKGQGKDAGKAAAAAPAAAQKAPIQSQAPAAKAAAAPQSQAAAGQQNALGMRAEAATFVPGKGWSQDLSGKTSTETKTRRSAAPPVSEASKRLPTYEKKDWIIAGIRHNTVTVISGDTGCGKSTLIPQLVCDAENLVPDDKVVVCTQPRRVAAITLAEYVSKDRGQELGDEVGYQIRFINKFSESTRLIYATTAIVLRRLHSEPELDSIGCLIIDEVHERDVYTDFLLLLLREAMHNGRMQHLKIILMSATLKAEDFANYFRKVNGDAALKPVHVPGRMFPVEDFYWEDACEWLNYCPPDKKGGKGGKGKGGKSGNAGDSMEDVYEKIQKDNTAKGRPGKDRVNDYSDKTLRACAAWQQNEVYVDVIEDLCYYLHTKEPKGDGAILIFLPGWGDITKVYIRLFQSGYNFQLITLHSLMTPEQQHEAFERPPPGKRKIVLSTNIAEASVTIDDIVYVIDSGVRKERAYDPALGQSSLDTKMVTKANAIQRRGRAGRCQEGMVIHLFPSYAFQTFDEFPLPQMLTSSMEEVVLQSKVIHGGNNAEISDMLTNSMAAPQKEAITQAVQLLKNMNCLTREGELTVLGRATAAIPVQPNVAKFLLFAAALRVIKPAAVIAAFLSVKSPFQQSVGGEKQSKGPTGKEYFNKGFASDHLMNLQAYCEWRRAVRSGRADDFCDEQGLSPETLDMAYMMTQQFVSFMMDADYDGTDVSEDDYGEADPVRKASEEDALVRAAMCAGFMPSVAALYKGNRSPYWYLDSNEEVSPFRGSANADYQMGGQDGQEWMAFSDAMKMGRFNSIMDSTLVFSPFVLLFANAVMMDEKKGEIRFDKWYAYYEKGPWTTELLKLRREVMPAFQECIQSRNLAAFPKDLVKRIANFCKSEPMNLTGLEPVARSIDEEVTGAARKHLSIFEWPADLGEDEEEEQD
mmetsp:Transcript_28676/g.66514  ORF Transcript_28676/g.66514 Transcript_28676/m.66514 type:complete len:1037 (+) Transcript_28676:142-3252(+)|eukprot:CAMPEP_0178403278 /NCGR_PEP_ID=MMETSP0689_2-20121128/17284_1 /TAXON_ID=160604 /ORGANISM="Amphidinium massartii, Strain CS-259" /LENGTH=1036 /DNA_ID=CAMNT_0020024223 /DNA_START=44 /DNA_END=3154 /DNA_ORIENTATION=+